MDQIGNSPKSATVSVWTGTVAASRKVDGFIGSAFFISPRLLLTAKHVVWNKNAGQWFADLRLGLVTDHQEILIKPEMIHLHETLDAALIQLQEPYDQQYFPQAAFREENFTGEIIDFSGINATNVSRDKSDKHTVGILDQACSAYCFDHRVKKGFSGGPVSISGRAEVIGIISQREKDDQETLFIPLYKCKDWLAKLNHSLQDPHLNDYLNPKPIAPVTVGLANKTIPHYITDLAIFIGRPHSAYEHILDYLLNYESEQITYRNKVKTCFCLYSNEEDQPNLFAEALGIRLEVKVKKLLAPGLLACKNAYSIKIINQTHFWDAADKTEFFDACLVSIAETMDLPIPDIKANHQHRCEKLYRELAGKNKNPLILVSDSTSNLIRSHWPFFNRGTIKKIKNREQWLKEFNLLWQTSAQKQQSNAPMVLLFCLRLPERITAKCQPCFQLRTITQNEFNLWHDGVHNLLRDIQHLIGKDISSQLTLFKTHFLNAHSHKNGNFQLSYQRFIEHTQTATQKMSKK